MTLMFDFQKLEVYQKAQRFFVTSKALVHGKSLERQVVDQLIRASYSIVLNIAEGSGRSTPADRKNFFTISRASVFECVAIMDILYIENHIDTATHKQQLEHANELSRMLFVMIRNLKT